LYGSSAFFRSVPKMHALLHPNMPGSQKHLLKMLHPNLDSGKSTEGEADTELVDVSARVMDEDARAAPPGQLERSSTMTKMHALLQPPPGQLERSSTMTKMQALLHPNMPGSQKHLQTMLHPNLTKTDTDKSTEGEPDTEQVDVSESARSASFRPGPKVHALLHPNMPGSQKHLQKMLHPNLTKTDSDKSTDGEPDTEPAADVSEKTARSASFRPGPKMHALLHPNMPGSQKHLLKMLHPNLEGKTLEAEMYTNAAAPAPEPAVDISEPAPSFKPKPNPEAQRKALEAAAQAGSSRAIAKLAALDGA